MKSLLVTFLFFNISSTLSAQLFVDASSNLPVNGASAQSMDVKAFDLDSDGDLDIVLANEFQGNTILYNDGNGVFTKAGPGVLPQVAYDSEDVIVDDFNSDGYPDLIFCSEDDVTLGRTDVHEYYLGQPNGNFTPSGYHFPDTEANAVIIFDLNGDEYPDVLFGNNGPIGAFINNGDGTFSNESTRFPSVNRTTQDLLALDVDGDGDTDVFEGNENGNLLYINDGTGNFTEESQTRIPLPNIETRKVSAGDVDKDGDLDLFLSNVSFISGKIRQNRLYINDGAGNFEDRTQEQLPPDFDHTVDAIFSDLDYDTHLDIVVSNVFGSPIRFYFNDGTGIFSEGSNRIIPQTLFRDALGVIAADVNGDDLADLYFCDRNTGTGNKDVLLIKKKLTGVEDKKEANFLVYPSPVGNVLQIELPDAEKDPGKWWLVSMSGKLIKQGNTHFPAALNLSGVTPGWYYLMISLKETEGGQLILVSG
jgi:hypothetical protein